MLQVIILKLNSKLKIQFEFNLTSDYMVPHQSAFPAETSSEDLLRVKGKLL